MELFDSCLESRFWFSIPPLSVQFAPSSSILSCACASKPVTLSPQSKVTRVFVAYQSINQEPFSAHRRPRHRARPQNLKETAPELIFRGGPQHSTGASFSLPSAVVFIGLQVLPPGRCIYPFRGLFIGPSYLESNVVELNTTDDQESKPKPQRLPWEGPRIFDLVAKCAGLSWCGSPPRIGIC